MQERLTNLKIGDSVQGIVTGVIDFGAFINVDGIEGLILYQKYLGKGRDHVTILRLESRSKLRS